MLKMRIVVGDVRKVTSRHLCGSLSTVEGFTKQNERIKKENKKQTSEIRSKQNKKQSFQEKN